MSVEWHDLLLTWSFRPLALAIIGVLMWLYFRGFQNQKINRVEQTTRPVKFYLSMGVALFALVSPLDQLGRHYFFVQVTQHLFLVSLFPALFMGANPLPTIFDGLPPSWHTFLDSQFKDWLPIATRLTPKSACWFLFVATVWLWYDPTLHALMLQSDLFYNLAIFMMMVGALLHWWHVMAAAPRLHSRLPGFTHMGYAFIGAAPLKIPGLIFLFAYLPFYSYPINTFLGFEIDPLLSQRLGGILIWSLGGVVYSTTAVSFFSSWLSVEETKPEQPRSIWDNEETFIAPHLE